MVLSMKFQLMLYKNLEMSFDLMYFCFLTLISLFSFQRKCLFSVLFLCLLVFAFLRPSVVVMVCRVRGRGGDRAAGLCGARLGNVGDTKRDQEWPRVTKHDHARHIVANRGHEWQIVTKRDQRWPRVAKSGQDWPRLMVLLQASTAGGLQVFQRCQLHQLLLWGGWKPDLGQSWPVFKLWIVGILVQ